MPDLTEDLLSSVDQPLSTRWCTKTKRDYLVCDYNRDGDSYRSPWSGEFEPALEQSSEGGVDEGAGAGAVPSDRVRKMEIRANEAFDVYRELYYEGGLSSVYFWNLDDGFAGVVLLKKGMFAALSTGCFTWVGDGCLGLDRKLKMLGNLDWTWLTVLCRCSSEQRLRRIMGLHPRLRSH